MGKECKGANDHQEQAIHVPSGRQPNHAEPRSPHEEEDLTAPGLIALDQQMSLKTRTG